MGVRLLKKVLISTSLVLGSLVTSIFFMEGVSRLFVDKLDFLTPITINHSVLRTTVKPYSAGHDKWGFRNKKVPISSDIIAIGDSQTYGVSATTKYSWPYQLERQINRKVYNI